MNWVNAVSQGTRTHDMLPVQAIRRWSHITERATAKTRVGFLLDLVEIPCKHDGQEGRIPMNDDNRVIPEDDADPSPIEGPATPGNGKSTSWGLKVIIYIILLAFLIFISVGGFALLNLVA